MAKDSFNWRSIFVNEASENAPNGVLQTPQEGDKKFPEKIPASSVVTSSNPYLDEVFVVYEKGLESLNHVGFDFFEMYKSVMAVGTSNPQSYLMAFAMGKTISPEITKSFLLEKAQYYITEIEKVYQKFDTKGNARKKDLSDSISKEKDIITKEITDIEKKILQLQLELETKKAAIQKIDPDNVAQFNELQQKIEANNMAKQKIMESINSVVTGINQYLQ